MIDPIWLWLKPTAASFSKGSGQWDNAGVARLGAGGGVCVTLYIAVCLCI